MFPRSHSKSVVFSHPFELKGVDRILPPGTYQVVTDEELIEELSFPVPHALEKRTWRCRDQRLIRLAWMAPPNRGCFSGKITSWRFRAAGWEEPSTAREIVGERVQRGRARLAELLRVEFVDDLNPVTDVATALTAGDANVIIAV
jgi:hypothetical protein